jgi:magnesium chelatase family protein
LVARVNTVAFQGIDVLDIDVQVQVSGGAVAFMVVGLPDKAVGESRERVRSALHALGLSLPPKRITVNLAPADVQKEGSHFDQSGLRKSGQRDKWSFCLKAASMRAAQEKQ